MKAHIISRGSRSARALAQKLREDYALNVYHVPARLLRRRAPRNTAPDIFINYGCTVKTWASLTTGKYRAPHLTPIINNPRGVNTSSNKITMLECLGRAFNVVDNTRDASEAAGWIEDGRTVFARTVLNGHGGSGIVMNELVDGCQLYTAAPEGEYTEYRLLVAFGTEVLLSQKKKMSSEKLEERGITFDKHIRSHDNGWVFARNDIARPSDRIIRTLCRSVEYAGLDFGAVDFLVTENGDYQIVEINSAPGLEGTSLEKMAAVLADYLAGVV